MEEKDIEKIEEKDILFDNEKEVDKKILIGPLEDKFNSQRIIKNELENSEDYNLSIKEL